MGIEAIYLNIIKARYDKSTASTILSGEKLNTFPLRPRTNMKKTTFIQHSFGSPSYSSKQKSERKGIQIGKEEVKFSLFADDIILYIENPKENY